MTKRSYAAAPAWVEMPIDFRKDDDLVNMKTGVYEEEMGRRIVWVSPAIHSLLRTDRELVLSQLKVLKWDKMVSILDIAE